MCCDSHRGAGNSWQRIHPRPIFVGNPRAGLLAGKVVVNVTDETVRSELAGNEEERCQCRGFDFTFAANPTGFVPAEYRVFPGTTIEDWSPCKCPRRIDGEDMRCPACRVYCDQDWVPRMMSDAARAAIERTKKQGTAE